MLLALCKQGGAFFNEGMGHAANIASALKNCGDIVVKQSVFHSGQNRPALCCNFQGCNDCTIVHFVLNVSPFGRGSGFIARMFRGTSEL